MIEKLKENMHRIQQGGSFIMFLVFFVVVVFVAYLFGRWSNPEITPLPDNQIKRHKIVETWEKGHKTKLIDNTWYWEPTKK